ncbi:MAG: DUF3618 domain-containing protein [Candidatus Binatia bacterium]
MEQSQTELRREIEATRAAMAEKIETLEARVGGVIEDAKRSVNPKYQTQQRPWPMMGIAIAAGYLLECLLFTRPSTRRRYQRRDKLAREYLERRYPKVDFRGQQKSAGFLKNIATAAGVALARDFATGVLSKRLGDDRRGVPSDPSRSSSASARS